MEKKLLSLRKRLAASRGAGERRYPAQLRAEVVETGRAWRSGGGSRAKLAALLAVNGSTLDYWLHGRRDRVEAVREVAVVAETRSQGLVAQFGGGVSVEGLTVEDLIALARGLA